MPTQQFGIENLKKLIKFGTGFTEQIAEALKDGKFTWPETFGFVDEVSEIPGVVKSFPAIKQEVSELSPEERKELYDYLVEEFDIPNERLEGFVEHSLMFAISAVVLVEEWKALKNPPVTP